MRIKQNTAPPIAPKKQDMLKLRPDQVKRLHFLQTVFDGHMSLRDAAEEMGVSYRQAKRLKQSFLKKGMGSVIHGNAGRRSSRALHDHLRIRIVHLARTRYEALSDTALTEILKRDHGIAVSRETVRRILRSEKISSRSFKNRRIARPAYCTREGMMVLWGGITKNWFGTGECCFMTAVDVATLQCLAARFFPEESHDGYFFLLRKIMHSRGIPRAICRHREIIGRFQKVFVAGESAYKQKTVPCGLAKAIEALGITYMLESSRRLIRIPALFETYLAEQIALHGIVSLERANFFLESDLIAGFNNHHACTPHNPQPDWRAAPLLTGLKQASSTPILRFTPRPAMEHNEPVLQPVIPCR